MHCIEHVRLNAWLSTIVQVIQRPAPPRRSRQQSRHDGNRDTKPNLELALNPNTQRSGTSCRLGLVSRLTIGLYIVIGLPPPQITPSLSIPSSGKIDVFSLRGPPAYYTPIGLGATQGAPHQNLHLPTRMAQRGRPPACGIAQVLLRNIKPQPTKFRPPM
jgi:hypothetical protein